MSELVSIVRLWVTLGSSNFRPVNWAHIGIFEKFIMVLISNKIKGADFNSDIIFALRLKANEDFKVF